jgi:hypothetical protein
MKRETSLTHEFVEFIPDELKDGTIYVSLPYATVAHKCCCGCGNEVITPLSPTDWKLIFDGESISLHPSIGNWSFACQSHYWIDRNGIKWARRWSQEEIDDGRDYDSMAKESYYDDSDKTPATHDANTRGEKRGEGKPEESLWQRLKRWRF